MYHMNYWNYKDFVKNLYEFDKTETYCNGKRLYKKDIDKCVDCEVVGFTINAKSKMAIIEVNGVY